MKSEAPKRRLSSLLSERQRRQLQLAMLEDTLQTVAKAKRIKHTYVVSSDRDILKFATRYGAGSIEEDGDRGVNAAVERAISELHRYAGWLVMPADLPLIRVRDIRTVLNLRRMGSSAVIAPSEDYSGTNLLLMGKKERIALHYDDDSFTKHVMEATTRGIPFCVYYSEGVSFDIDSSADVHRYFRFGRRNSTMTFLGRTLGVTLSAKLARNRPTPRDRSGEPTGQPR